MSDLILAGTKLQTQMDRMVRFSLLRMMTVNVVIHLLLQDNFGSIKHKNVIDCKICRFGICSFWQKVNLVTLQNIKAKIILQLLDFRHVVETTLLLQAKQDYMRIAQGEMKRLVCYTQ